MAPISGHEEQEAGLSIGAAALQTGHTPVTLRHWERLGLIDPPPRRGGRRRYPPSVATRIALIDIARAAGFRLAEIRELLADRDPRRTAGERWRALAARKRAQLDEAAAAIQAMHTLLTHLSRCRCASLEECAARLSRRSVPGSDRSLRIVLEALEAQKQRKPPDLP